MTLHYVLWKNLHMLIIIYTRETCWIFVMHFIALNPLWCVRIIYNNINNKSSPRDCSLAGRISRVYKLYNRVAYNRDMKADVYGYGEKCNSSHFQ